MTDTNRPKERRLHPRVTLKGELRLGDEGSGPALLENISMSGVACVSPVTFEEMTVLELAMELPFQGGRRSFKAGGAVVRSEPRNEGGFRLAVFFTHMDEAARSTLLEYIEQEEG